MNSWNDSTLRANPIIHNPLMKKKRKSKDEVKEELLKSLVERDDNEIDDLNERAMNVASYQEAIPIINE